MARESIVRVAAMVLSLSSAAAGAPLGSGFTYQGQLQDGTVPTTATSCDFQFSLVDSLSGGAQIGATQAASSVPVSGGVFSVELNGAGEFGATAFDGSDRWLQIAVRCPSGGGSFSAPFSPLQKLSAAPNALYSKTAGDVSCSGCVGGTDIQVGAIGAMQLGDGQVTSAKILDGAVGSADLANGAVTVDKIAPGSNGQVLTTSAGAAVWQAPTGSGWGLSGNAGTNPSSNYLGTSDNQALELRVNGQRALRLVPPLSSNVAAVARGSNNVILGSPFNSMGGGVVGGTISGGGIPNGDSIDPAMANRVLDDGGTVGGGFRNAASSYSTVAGGLWNTASYQSSTVGGGYRNMATGSSSTIAGGDLNTASGHYSAVAGGAQNTASGLYSAVAGGDRNTAAGDYSFAAGLRAKANHVGSFVWADSTAASFESAGVDTFNIRATKGVRLGKNAGNASIGTAAGQYYRDNAIIAWGSVTAAGTVNREFGVYTLSKLGTGHYQITVDVTPESTGSLVPVANAEIDSAPTSAALARLVTVNEVDADTFEVFITNGSYALVDNDFTFIATGRGDE